MDTSKHGLPAFFAQLGLPDDARSIDEFVASHRLPAGTSIARAPFWTPAQASLIRDALLQDSDWAEEADALAALLTANHPG